jgi:hypothetical protein
VEYLKLIGKRWWVVAAIAAVSGLVVSLMFLVLRPRTYTATATVIVPAPSDTGSVIPATAQAVADLEAVVETRAVADEVAQKVGLTADEVAGVLDTRRLGGAGVVEIRATARNPSIAEAIAVEAGRSALTLLAQARLAPYQQRLQLAERAYQEAADAVQAFLERFGHLLPQDEFDRIGAELTDLRVRADQARAAGDRDQEAKLEARIASLTAQWSPLIVEWQTLSAARSRAQRQLETAQLDFAAAQSELAAATTGTGDVIGSRAVPVPRVRILLRSGLPIVVLATVLGILLVVGLELARPSSGRGTPTEAAVVPPSERRTSAGT